jgi:hypothetical protein
MVVNSSSNNRSSSGVNNRAAQTGSSHHRPAQEESSNVSNRGQWRVRTTAKSRLVTKIGISALFGAVAFLLAQGLDAQVGAPVILGIGASVFVSGVAFMTQFLVEVEERIDNVDATLQSMENRYDQHNRETRRMITDEFTKINAATELFGAVEASALKTDAVTQLVKNSTAVQRDSPSLVFDFAQAEITRLSGYLKVLGHSGDVVYEGEDRDWLLGLTRVASMSVDATSLTTVDAGGRGFVDGGLWNSDLGQRYLEAQRDAIKRGVAIRRVFIVDRPELQDDPDFVSILLQHVDIQVNVRTLRADAIVATRRASLIDFIVIDGVLSYQATPASRVANRPPTIATTTLVTDSDRVQERVARYEDLWASASPFHPERFTP